MAWGTVLASASVRCRHQRACETRQDPRIRRFHDPAGKSAEFEEAIRHGISTVISQAKGFRDAQGHRGIESPERYLLTIQWETLENHTVDFRGRPLFPAWRAIVGPYFAKPKVVEHFDRVAAGRGRPPTCLQAVRQSGDLVRGRDPHDKFTDSCRIGASSRHGRAGRVLKSRRPWTHHTVCPPCTPCSSACAPPHPS